LVPGDDVKMAHVETHGGESRTTCGDICLTLPAGNELFIDPNKHKSRARENKGVQNTEAGKEMLNSALQNKIKKRQKLGLIQISLGRWRGKNFLPVSHAPRCKSHHRSGPCSSVASRWAAPLVTIPKIRFLIHTCMWLIRFAHCMLWDRSLKPWRNHFTYCIGL
jgi:hypothetical protein